MMKMMKVLLFGLCLSVLFAGCVSKQSTSSQSDRKDVLYSCNCGSHCKCNSVSAQPGKCACGKPLKWGHVLKVEGDESILCQCNEGCKCTGLNDKDPAKCNCGNPIKRISLKGTGVSFCNCGGSCFCNTVSDQPEKCKCGMSLKKI